MALDGVDVAGGSVEARLSLRDRAYRLPTIGVVLVVTVVAVEALAVATVMPTVARSLHGLRLYGWAFTAFFLADIVGMVAAGRRTDRGGPRSSLVAGLAAFAAGLLVAASAPTMPMFVVGRTLQGLGGGSVLVAVNVLVGRAFPVELRPRVLAASAAAWVVPALVGPVVAGGVASAFGWRWVFAGIAPIAALGALLLVPVLRALPAAPPSTSAPRLGLAGGACLAVGLAALQAAGTRLNWAGAVLGAAGAAVALAFLRRLLPAGSLRLVRGLPTVVVLRGFLSGAFFGAQAYLPLTLTRLHHGTPAIVGVPLTLAAVGWAAGARLQGRKGTGPRQARLLSAGFMLVASAVAALTSLAATATSIWLATPIWMVAGFGMGLASPTTVALTLQLSPTAEQGANSAAMQVTDTVGTVVTIGTGAAIIGALRTSSYPTAITIIDLGLACVALAGMLASRRATPLAPIAARADT